MLYGRMLGRESGADMPHWVDFTFEQDGYILYDEYIGKEIRSGLGGGMEGAQI
jgi:hypothetical protein